MSQISFAKNVSLQQAAELILATPNVRYLLLGEPGIGKSSLLGFLSNKLPDYNTAYIDVPNMDLGDIAMPVIDHETKTTRYYPNARFRLHEGKPVVIMLDEYTKGFEPVKNMLHPMLEAHNPRLGDLPIDKNSIVFLTGNLSSDGVGDHLKAHTRNRLVHLTVRKPNAEEWLEWAANNNIEPVVMAFVHQYPHVLASYLDEGQENNLYIFQPSKVQDAVVSPRSLERLSNIVRVRKQFDSDTLIAAMKGAVGEAAARDIQAFIDYQDQLPAWENVIKNPTTAPIPDSAGAIAVMIYGALERMDKNNIQPWMDYLERFEPEWQAAFCINLAKKPSKQAVAFSSKRFADWVQANEDIL